MGAKDLLASLCVTQTVAQAQSIAIRSEQLTGKRCQRVSLVGFSCQKNIVYRSQSLRWQTNFVEREENISIGYKVFRFTFKVKPFCSHLSTVCAAPMNKQFNAIDSRE
jgi:hypothetical protein